MKFSEADTAGGLVIRAYEAGRIVVGATAYRRSLIVTPERVVDDWRPQRFDQIEAGDFVPVLALEPELIVLGTGAVHAFPDPALYADVLTRGVGLEVMDTGAACRTYNILMSEGRRAAAALLMI